MKFISSVNMEKDKPSPQKHQEQKNYNTPIKFMKMVPHIFQSPSRPSFSQTADRQEGTTKGSPFKFINTFSTPPTGVSKVKNPFEGALMERLHLPMYSPSVFASIPNSDNTNKTPDFRWTIEEMSELMPAQIDEHSNMQFEQIDEDPELEIKAQEKIEKYFSEKHIVPSPWGVAVKNVNILPKTPQHCVQEKVKTATKTRDGVAQTVLTFPSNIPPHIEELLQPFMNFTEDQQQSTSNDENLSNTSLYRKLFHNSPASIVSSEELEGDCQAFSPICLSLPPIKASDISTMGRHFGSPSDQPLMSSPLDISPIKCSPIQIHRSTPSPHKQTDVGNRYCPDSLEDSPLSPISKMSMESVNGENSSLRNKQRQNTVEVKTNEFSATNDRNTSPSRLSNDLSMDISMSVVPESDNLPEPSNYSNLGTSLLHNEVGNCTYSSVNWDIENQTMSKSVKRPRNDEFDNRVTSYSATENITSAMDTSVSNTPRKSERKYSISKKLSSNFTDIEEQSFENVDKKWIVNINNLEDKENIAPLIVLSNKRVQLRRSFSDVPSGSKISSFRCRDSKYYKEERFNKYRKCGSFSSTNDDSFIRDRSLLNSNRSDSPFDFKDDAFDNTFTFSQNTQDTGYGSNNGSESSSLLVTNILTATKISSDLITNDSMFGANNSTSQNINKGPMDQFNNCFASTPAKTGVLSSQNENDEKLYSM